MNATAETTSELRTQRIEELGRIIMAYSEMTERLQQSHEQLKSQVVKLRSELSEKSRLLERRNRLAALGEMAAGLAHEIRNPLGGIQLYAGMLGQDLVDRPESQQIVRKITNGVKRLESLVSQVLQFTREIRADIRECDLAQIAADAVEMAQHKAEQSQVELRVEGPDLLQVQADPNLLGQALLNLILNAIDAQAQKGSVLVRFAVPTEGRALGQFVLEVIDSGTGIAPEVLDRIFNPFYTTKDEGTGLGLAIVHRIIEAHDGTITAANVPGGGAKFEIRM
jgi:signal transduction histidine kinase